MNPLIRDLVMMFVRQGATALGVWLVGKSIIEPEQTEAFVAGLTALAIGAGGAAWTVYRRRIKLLAALASGSETTEHELESMLNDPAMVPPPASKRKDQKPYFKHHDVR